METLLPEGQFIYSRTDLRGIIVEANEAFAHISGYRREDMIGQPHNMVRHPRHARTGLQRHVERPQARPPLAAW